MIEFRYVSSIFSLNKKKHTKYFCFQIFENIIDGKLFQTISCYKPRSLTSFNINMDTIIAFIQDDTEVKVSIVIKCNGKCVIWVIRMHFFIFIADIRVPWSSRICRIYITTNAIAHKTYDSLWNYYPPNTTIVSWPFPHCNYEQSSNFLQSY